MLKQRVGHSRRLNLATVVVALAVPTVLAACGADLDGPAAGGGGDEYVVGEIADLTAGYTENNVPMHEGIDAAFQQINENGGIHGKEIKLVSLDAAGSPSKGLNAFRQLQSQGALAILNVGDSRLNPQVFPAAESAKIPIISAGLPAAPEPDSYIFEYGPTSTLIGEAQMSYVAALEKSGELDSPKVMAVSYPSPQGQEYAAAAKQFAESQGWEFVGEVFPASREDYATTAAKIVQLAPDVIVGGLLAGDTNALLDANIAAGLPADTTYLGYPWSSMKETQASAFASVQTYQGQGDEPATVEYREAMESAGYDPDGLMAVDGYAGAMIFADALERCGEDCTGERLHDVLQETDTDLGGLAFGPIRFTRDYHLGVTELRLLEFTSKCPCSGDEYSEALPVESAP
jgi:branched-chain amino acid transport system substrate-binding protein